MVSIRLISGVVEQLVCWKEKGEKLQFNRYLMSIVILMIISTFLMSVAAATTTIDFHGITSPSSTDVARYDIDEANKEDDPTIGTEFTTAMYGAVSSSDDTYAVTRVLHIHDYAQQIFRFKVRVPVSQFTLTWEGNIAFAYSEVHHKEGIEIWDEATNSWEWLGTVSQDGDFYANPPAPPVGASVQDRMAFMVADETISKIYATGVSNYIDNNYISLMVWAKNSQNATISTDYVKLDYIRAYPYESEAVGGFWTPINKVELLAPWIGLVSLIAVATISVAYVKHRKKQQN